MSHKKVYKKLKLQSLKTLKVFYPAFDRIERNGNGWMD